MGIYSRMHYKSAKTRLYIFAFEKKIWPEKVIIYHVSDHQKRENAIDCFLWQHIVYVSRFKLKYQGYCQTHFAFSCLASKFGERKCLFNASQSSNQSVYCIQAFY